MENTQERKAVTQEEFNKRVDIAFAYMTYMDRLKPEEARQKAYEEVKNEYRIVG